MSKYKPKVYAKALVDLLSSKKTATEYKKITDSFSELLQKNSDTKKVREIIFLAENLLFKKSGKRKVILETARKINSQKMAKYLSAEDYVVEKVNPELIAGVKIVANHEMQLDFSFKKLLNDVFSA